MKKRRIRADSESQSPAEKPPVVTLDWSDLGGAFGKVAEEGGALAKVTEQLQVAPTSPGVYLMKDAGGHVIYVGKAKNLRSRVRSYFQKLDTKDAKTAYMVPKIQFIEFLRTTSETEALLLENNLIKKWKPRYNLRLRDDKTYPYIRLDAKHPFPRPSIARRQLRGDGSRYFGPFPNAGAMREALHFSGRLFQLRDCRDTEFANRSRPCLSYEIGQCSAPCVGYVSKEEYGKQVDAFAAYLDGHTPEIEEKWRMEMEAAAENMEFEKAGALRDRIQNLHDSIASKQRIVDTNDLSDRDIWAFYPPLDAPAPLAEGEVAGTGADGDSEAAGSGSGRSEAESSEAESSEAESSEAESSEAESSEAESSEAESSEAESSEAESSEAAGFEAESSETAGKEIICFVILQFRQGKWVGRDVKSLELDPGALTTDTRTELLDQIVLQYYGKRVIPEEVLLPPINGSRSAGPLAEALRKFAEERKESAQVSVHFADEKAEWAKSHDLAVENARGIWEEETRKTVIREDSLGQLQKWLELPRLPRRMECIDISNMQGEANVASVVVFENGYPLKADYRHYKIQGFVGQNDFASMKEVIARRFGKAVKDMPDLLVVDGGRGQLASVEAVLKELKLPLPIIGLAKARTEGSFQDAEVKGSEERVFLPGQKNPKIIKNAAVLRLLTQIRDEAHRFAISFHRAQRAKTRGL